MVRLGLTWALVGSILAGVAFGATETRRPNVVILLPDQLRWAELGCYGHPVVKTPNIDRLASQGVRLTNAFSNDPICSPARSILLSGRYARSTGVLGNQDNEASPGRRTNKSKTLAETLSAAGYDTALIGKWHLQPTPAALGFKESERCRMRHRYYKQTYYHNEGEGHVCEEYSPHHETAAAVQYIRDHRDRPFFLYLTYGPPHMPVSEMPEKYKTMYDPAQVVLRDNVWKDGKPAYNEEWFKTYMWDFQYYQHKDTWKQQLPAGMDLRMLTALYYGQITAIDDCVGQVLAAIKDTGIEDDTIVLLTSDHGDLLGSHQLFNKHKHWDEATHVPMIVRYPRELKPAVVDTQVVSLVDAMPTLLDLCGVAAPSSVEGTSVAAVLQGKAKAVGANAAFIETGDDGVRTQRYLYFIEGKAPHQEHLFDCEQDPYQMHDLAAEPGSADVLKDLRKRVESWQKDTPAARRQPGRRRQRQRQQ